METTTWIERQQARAEGLVATRVWWGTDRMPGEPVRDSFRLRLRRCYELAGYAMLMGDLPKDARLVHGTIDGGPGTLGPIGHAWVRLPNGRVWEPIFGDVYRSEEAWVAWAHPTVEREYTRGAAMAAALTAQHWGPWH